MCVGSVLVEYREYVRKIFSSFVFSRIIFGYGVFNILFVNLYILLVCNFIGVFVFVDL